MGEAPIPNPLDDSWPFQSPHFELVLALPGGGRAELWFYLVALEVRPRCPQLRYRDVPVLLERDRLVGVGWAALRARLEEYGRSADWYRQLRNPRFGRCSGR